MYKSKSKIILISGLLILGSTTLCSGYAAPPPLLYGLGIGLGTGLPFINVCFNAPRAFNSLFLRNFGNDKMKAKILPRVGDQPRVNCPDSLNCNFEKDCLTKWQNDETDRFCEQSMYLMNGKPKFESNWTELMGGGGEFPKGQYIVSGSKRAVGGQPIYLTSNIVPSQRGEGKLKLNYWITEPAVLQVCVKPESTKYVLVKDLCSKPVGHSSTTSEAVFDIKGPIKENFKIVIVSSNFTQRGIGLVAVDNIEYWSPLCGKSQPF